MLVNTTLRYIYADIIDRQNTLIEREYLNDPRKKVLSLEEWLESIDKVSREEIIEGQQLIYSLFIFMEGKKCKDWKLKKILWISWWAYLHRLSNGWLFIYPKEGLLWNPGIITTKFAQWIYESQWMVMKGNILWWIYHFLEHKVFEDENGHDYLKIVHLGSESTAFTSFYKDKGLSQQLQRSLENIQLLLEMVSKCSLYSNLYLWKEKSFNKEIECTKIVQTGLIIFGVCENLYPKHC